MTVSGRRSPASPISRRNLIASGAAASLLAAAGVPARAEPRSSGLLRLALPAAGDTLARLIAPGTVFDCLTEVGADGSLRGELAEAWEAAADASRWTITLREGPTFHDGRPVGAEDVVALLAPRVGADGPLRLATGVSATGPRTVALRLSAPDTGLPFRLSDPRLAIRSAAQPRDVGSGLYRITRQGDGWLRMARVEGHYRGASAGRFDAIEILLRADPADRLDALRLARVDVATGIDPLELPALGRAPRLAALSLPSGRHLRIRVRGGHARSLSAALKAGLDRPGLLADMLCGQGCVAADHPLHAAAVPEHDPDRARHQLRADGVDRATIAFGAGMAEAPGLDRLVSVLHRTAGGLGLRLSPASEAAAELTVEMAPAQPTEDMALSAVALDGVADPTALCRKLARARAERNSAYAAEIRQEVAQTLSREAWTIVPVFAHALFAHSVRLTHPGRVGVLDTLDSARIAERWRLSSHEPSS